MVDVQHGVRIYHWKHGWIPLDHFAALKKAHGSERGARRALDRAAAAGHAHKSFADTGTHRGGHGAGAHLRRADGFQPVANEHLRRDKHIVAAFHENSRQFHLLDLERKHSAVISEADARQIHMDGHKIVGISKSESGGTQIKVMNMVNGRVHRIDAVSDGLSKQLKPEPAKPAPKRNAFAEAGAREAQRKADALAFAKAEKEREAADRAARAAKEPSKTHETVAVPGTPREERAGRFKAAQAERAKAFQEQHAGAGDMNLAQLDAAIKAARDDHGNGAPEHKAAIAAFNSKLKAEMPVGAHVEYNAANVQGARRVRERVAGHYEYPNGKLAPRMENGDVPGMQQDPRVVSAGIVDGRAEREAAAARADAKRAAMKAENEAKAKAVAEREVAKANAVARNLAAIQAKNAMAEGNAGNHREAADLYGKAAQQFDRAGEKAAGDAARALADHHQRVIAAKAGAKPSAPKPDAERLKRDIAAQIRNATSPDKRADAYNMLADHLQNGRINKQEHAQYEAQIKDVGAQYPASLGLAVESRPPRPLEPDLQRRVDAGGLAEARAHEINQGRYARELQIKGNRLRNVDRIQEHRAHVAATPNIQERHREILLKQIDRKLGNNERVAQRKAQEAGRAAEQARQDREAFAGGATEKHFENGGSILSAPVHDLRRYVMANPDRFSRTRLKKNGNVSDSYMIRDKKTGEIVFEKDNGGARHGAVKEKLAGDIGNALGFFEHKANMDGGSDHVFIGNANPGKGDLQGAREHFGPGNTRMTHAQNVEIGQMIRKGSDPASLARMMMFDYLVANDEDRHLQNFHIVDEGGGRARGAILDHGRAFGGAYSNFGGAPAHADFARWFRSYKEDSARGWDAYTVAREAYPHDHDASAAYDQVVGQMKQANIEDVIKQAFNAPGVSIPADKQAQWENLIRGRYAHLIDPKNKAGIIAAMKGA